MLNAFKIEQSSKLGRLVVAKGWVNEVQLERALSHQAENHCKLGESLLQLAMLTPQQLEKVLCKQRWVRSFVAGMVMVSSPICPVLASEVNDTLKFVVQSDSNWLEQSVFHPVQGQVSAHVSYTDNKDYQLGVRHRFTSHSGIEVGVATPQKLNPNHRTQADQPIVPQITFFTSQGQVKKAHRPYLLQDTDRADRYKDTIPAIYRLTLKGFSIYETTDSASKFWEFEKISDSPYKNYELMFSFTKHF